MLTEPIETHDGAAKLSGWRRHFHFDFHVLLVLIQRGWGIIAGAVTVAFIPLWFTQVEQGYYYTFLSLLALQVFFELGFNVVVVQLVGHEAARLSIATDGSMTGDPTAIARLRSLLRLIRRWYFVAALLFFGGVSLAGHLFFGSKGQLPESQWIAAWVALVLVTAVNLYLSPLLAVLEGIGRVGQVARLRLIQSMVGYSMMWAALSLGAGLNAMVVVPGTGALLSLWWLRRHRGLLRPPPLAPGAAEPVMAWRTEILPLQWRIAVSWMSGYFIFYAFTPLIFAHQGAVEAGRVGLALALFSSLSTLGMSWINAAAPRMVNLVALGERKELNRLFVTVVKSAMAFTLLTALLILGCMAVLTAAEVTIIGRIASLPVLACLAIVTVTNSFIFAAATYMRAHKVEPMLAASAVGGLITLAIAYFASKVGTGLTMALYAASTVAIGLPWTVIVFLPYFSGRTSQKPRPLAMTRPSQHGGDRDRSVDLTIYLSCYNRPVYARQAIESLLNQTSKRFRLRISDNSTTDAVAEMVATEYSQLDYIRRTPSTHACLHGNRILDECESSYVMIMHDDDMLDRTYVEEMLAFIEAFPDATCYASNALKVDGEGRVICNHFYLALSRYQFCTNPLWLLNRWFSYGTFAVAPLPSYIYDVEKIRGIRFDSQKHGQMNDFVFIHQCIQRPGGLAWINKPLYQYRVHSNQDSAAITELSWRLLRKYVRAHHPDHYRSATFLASRALHLRQVLVARNRPSTLRVVNRVAVVALLRSPDCLLRRIAGAVFDRVSAALHSPLRV